jgi:hypothetical protein
MAQPNMVNFICKKLKRGILPTTSMWWHRQMLGGFVCNRLKTCILLTSMWHSQMLDNFVYNRLKLGILPTSVWHTRCVNTVAQESSQTLRQSDMAGQALQPMGTEQ